MVSAHRLIETPILTGPTASGKTAFALALAERHGLEILNADSLLVYRGFDIGTAKPTPEERGDIPHHLIDIRDPEQSFTAADFVREIEAALQKIHERGRRALIVGGTPFYLKALSFGLWEAPPTHEDYRRSIADEATDSLFEQLRELDPAHAVKIGSSDRYRLVRALEILRFSGRRPSELEAEARNRAPDPRFPIWVLDRPQQELENRIHQRTNAMLLAGLIEETRRLRDAHPTARALGSVGYAQVVDHLDERQPRGRKRRPGIDGLTDEIRLATRQLVKAQRTFFRGLKHAQWFLFDQDRPKLETLARQTFASADAGPGTVPTTDPNSGSSPSPISGSRPASKESP